MKLPTDTTGHPFEGQFKLSDLEAQREFHIRYDEVFEVQYMKHPRKSTAAMIRELRDRLKQEREARQEAQELVEQYEHELLNELSLLLGDEKAKNP